MSDKVSDEVTCKVTKKADGPASDTPIPRRSFLLGAGTAVAAGLGPAANAQTPAAAANPAVAKSAPEPEPLHPRTIPAAP
jgi:hypothetical protein